MYTDPDFVRRGVGRRVLALCEAAAMHAGSSKFGGVAVQGFALIGFIPTLTGVALALLGPIALSTALVAWAGRETRGRSLRELEAAQ